MGKFFQQQNIEILSTGGTASALKNAGIQVKEVAEHTGKTDFFSFDFKF